MWPKAMKTGWESLSGIPALCAENHGTDTPRNRDAVENTSREDTRSFAYTRSKAQEEQRNDRATEGESCFLSFPLPSTLGGTRSWPWLVVYADKHDMDGTSRLRALNT